MTLWVRVQIFGYTGILEVIGSVGPYQHDGGRCRLQRKTLRSCYIWEVADHIYANVFTFSFQKQIFLVFFGMSWRRFCLNFFSNLNTFRYTSSWLVCSKAACYKSYSAAISWNKNLLRKKCVFLCKAPPCETDGVSERLLVRGGAGITRGTAVYLKWAFR